jgi:hypothetical protein
VAGRAVGKPRDSGQVDHTAWATLLRRYCRTSRDGINRVAYAAMGEEARAALDTYLAGLSAARVSALGRAAQLAFWVNLHNALAVRLVLDHYPLASIRDLGVSSGGPPKAGPWAAERIRVEGRSLSIAAVADDIIRAQWTDPRVNYMICCATLGAPNLMQAPLEPPMLDRQLDAAAIAFVNHPRGVSLPEGRLRVSSVYVWHEREFGKSQHAVVKHLMAYAAPQLAMQLRGRRAIDEHDYDWRLNDAPSES